MVDVLKVLKTLETIELCWLSSMDGGGEGFYLKLQFCKLNFLINTVVFRDLSQQETYLRTFMNHVEGRRGGGGRDI